MASSFPSVVGAVSWLRKKSPEISDISWVCRVVTARIRGDFVDCAVLLDQNDALCQVRGGVRALLRSDARQFGGPDEVAGCVAVPGMRVLRWPFTVGLPGSAGHWAAGQLSDISCPRFEPAGEGGRQRWSLSTALIVASGIFS